MNSRRWERCIHHRAQEADHFLDEYFSHDDRNVFLLGGAGFDPRSQRVPEALSAICGNRLKGLFLREERPDPDEGLLSQAEANDAQIRSLIPAAEIEQIQVFGIDDAPVGGRRAVKLLSQKLNLDSTTDLVLDCSALSVGVMFPIARFCLESAAKRGSDVNFHLLVLDSPNTDASIDSTSCGKAAPIHTFKGGLDLDDTTDAVRLWLPQLGFGRKEVLNLIYQHVKPHAVSPIIPFPSTEPRQGDRLIEEYRELFDTIGGSMTTTWDVDSRDIVYAHEKNPLDLYRSVLNIADARERVFDETGGSQLVLSPLGSKAIAVGLLMAALDGDFAVVSVESLEYKLRSNTPKLSADQDAELVHVWLHGAAYCYDKDAQEAHS